MDRRTRFSWLANVLPSLAGFVLFFLMVLTCADVIGRYFFNAPLPGAFEATGIGVAVVIYAALPFVTARDEHVTVSLLDAVIPDWLQTIQTVVIRLVCIAVLCLVAWALWRTANGLAAARVRTDAFRIPIAPIPYFMSIMTWLTVVMLASVTALSLTSAFRSRRGGASQGSRP